MTNYNNYVYNKALFALALVFSLLGSLAPTANAAGGASSVYCPSTAEYGSADSSYRSSLPAIDLYQPGASSCETSNYKDRTQLGNPGSTLVGGQDFTVSLGTTTLPFHNAVVVIVNATEASQVSMRVQLSGVQAVQFPDERVWGSKEAYAHMPSLAVGLASYLKLSTPTYYLGTWATGSELTELGINPDANKPGVALCGSGTCLYRF